MTKWSDESSEILSLGGWFPGRSIDITCWTDWLEDSGFVIHDPFRSFIAEFGEIEIEQSGPGIAFRRSTVEFDPSLARGEEERFLEWSMQVHKQIIPIGELDQGRYFLGLDEDFSFYLVVDWLARFGAGKEGLDNLLGGGAFEVLYDQYPAQLSAVSAILVIVENCGRPRLGGASSRGRSCGGGRPGTAW
ncbi:SUKH-3 domain-containing protein [Glycomyces sambucus]|uniref:SUKH-3 domain-containing protein n=1 Tax=Glycomyces sambucus TaxID=380244 RepID=UPI000B88F534